MLSVSWPAAAAWCILSRLVAPRLMREARASHQAVGRIVGMIERRQQSPLRLAVVDRIVVERLVGAIGRNHVGRATRPRSIATSASW